MGLKTEKRPLSPPDFWLMDSSPTPPAQLGSPVLAQPDSASSETPEPLDSQFGYSLDSSPLITAADPAVQQCYSTTLYSQGYNPILDYSGGIVDIVAVSNNSLPRFVFPDKTGA